MDNRLRGADMSLRRYSELARGGPIGRSKNKYNARRTYSDLWRRYFDSGAECKYADHLYGRREYGDIEDVEFQVVVPLIINGVNLDIRWKIDFRYFEHKFRHKHTEQMVWDEFKGFATADFKLKRKLWSAGAGLGLLRVTYARKSSKLDPYLWHEYWPADWTSRQENEEHDNDKA